MRKSIPDLLCNSDNNKKKQQTAATHARLFHNAHNINNTETTLRSATTSAITFRQMFEMVMRCIERQQIGQFADAGWQLANLVLTETEDRQILPPDTREHQVHAISLLKR